MKRTAWEQAFDETPERLAEDIQLLLSNRTSLASVKEIPSLVHPHSISDAGSAEWNVLLDQLPPHIAYVLALRRCALRALQGEPSCAEEIMNVKEAMNVEEIIKIDRDLVRFMLYAIGFSGRNGETCKSDLQLSHCDSFSRGALTLWLRSQPQSPRPPKNYVACLRDRMQGVLSDHRTGMPQGLTPRLADVRWLEAFRGALVATYDNDAHISPTMPPWMKGPKHWKGICTPRRKEPLSNAASFIHVLESGISRDLAIAYLRRIDLKNLIKYYLLCDNRKKMPTEAGVRRFAVLINCAAGHDGDSVLEYKDFRNVLRQCGASYENGNLVKHAYRRCRCSLSEQRWQPVNSYPITKKDLQAFPEREGA